MEAGCLDVTLLAAPLSGAPPLALTPVTGSDHARVARAHRHRSDVHAGESEHGVLVVGRGLGDRWEVAFDVDPAARNAGHGRLLAAAARHLTPDGRATWAQCAPGNASSLRVLLAAGYRPVGSEVILMPPGPATTRR